MPKSSTEFKNTSPALGLLGGGQLAQMLCEAADKLSLSVEAMTTSESDPAAKTYSFHTIGNLDNKNDLTAFFKTKAIVLFENEFLNIEQIESSKSNSLQFIPELHVLTIAQDKLKQKSEFKKCDLSTSEWKVFEGRHFELFQEFCVSCKKQWPAGAILKWSRWGYDGKGNLPLKPGELPLQLLAFFNEAHQKGAQIYAEPLIEFKNEVAMVAALDKTGKLLNYPLVITEQNRGACQRVFGPATAFGIDKLREQEAIHAMKTLARHLDLRGVFALEFFNVSDHLIINELAPRVHNSGHFSQDAANISQFELHLIQAIQGPTPEIKTAPYFYMYNLLGPQNLRRRAEEALHETCKANIKLLSKDFKLHWYQKEPRPHRKLGHINFRANDRKEFDEKRAQLAEFESWWESLEDI